MSKRVKLDEFYWHEALDRTCVVASIMEKELREHPAVKQTKAMRAEVDKAIEALWRAYQIAGNAKAAHQRGHENVAHPCKKEG